MKIRLNAQDKLVGYFEIPHYNPMPDVVTWGTRVFKMRLESPYNDSVYVYDECFCLALVGERKDS